MTKKKSQIVKHQEYAEVQVVQEPTPPRLLEMAIKNNLPIEQIERFIALHERWQAIKAKESFNHAFAKFQSIVPDLTKNKKAEFEHRDGSGRTSYQYQDLPDILKHIRTPLAECGLSYEWRQHEEMRGNEVVISVKCIIKHKDGHENVSDELTATMDTSGKKTGIHAKASTITYLRRYTLTGMLGLASADRDDDGVNAVVEQEKNAKPRISQSQMRATIQKIKEKQTTVDKVKEYFVLSPDEETALRTIQDNVK